MKNVKVLNSRAFLKNIASFSDKKICLMIKADAYGHGMEQIIKLANKYVACFGVVNIDEAVRARLYTKKPIIIFGRCFEYDLCKKYNLQFMVDDEKSLLDAIERGCKNLLHLAINCGMNRFGVKGELNLHSINKILTNEKVKLRSVYTHFSDTTDYKKTLSQHSCFTYLKSVISQNAPVCLGGSEVHEYNFDCDILRLGIGAYGYENGEPVMKICSYVCKITYVNAGEYIGYGKKFRLKKASYVACVPVGYADGLQRSLSGKFQVKIGKNFYKSIGNICMDCFFVLVDENVRQFDKVEVMANASYLAKKMNTISYEILTGFSSFRGETLIEYAVIEK